MMALKRPQKWEFQSESELKIFEKVGTMVALKGQKDINLRLW